MASSDFSKFVNEYGATIAKTLKDIRRIIENPSFIKSRTDLPTVKGWAYNRYALIEMRTGALDSHHLRPVYDKLKTVGNELMVAAVKLMNDYGNQPPYAKAQDILDRLWELANLATRPTIRRAIKTGNELLETITKRGAVA